MSHGRTSDSDRPRKVSPRLPARPQALSGERAQQQPVGECPAELALPAGTSAIFDDSPIQRAVRDVQVISQHAFGAEGRFASAAQAYWGVPVDFPLLEMD